MLIRRDTLITVSLAIGLGWLASCAPLQEQRAQPSTETPFKTWPSPGPSTSTAAATADSSSVGNLWLTEVMNATARGAVCNDGSPARYYFRQGSDAWSRLWVIHLQGGGMCYNQKSCDNRKAELPELMTSEDKPPSRPGNGIESISTETNPDFSKANHVFVVYCSSDLWSGDREASSQIGGLQFRGARILRAVIDDLTNPASTPAPNLADAKQVLFSGSSAGGAGVLVHLDWLAERLPNATVRGINDAGWFVDLQPYDPNIDPPITQTQRGYEFWNATVDASCAAANPGAESRCFMGQYVYPFLTTPLFVQIAQSDEPQLLQLGLKLPPDNSEQANINTFGEAVRASLEPVSAAFSPATRTHGLLSDEKFWTMRINGLSLRDVLGNWFFGRPGPVKVIGR